MEKLDNSETTSGEYKPIQYKIVILGDIAVGKSSIAQRYYFFNF